METIPFCCSTVLAVSHDLAHQVNTQSTGLPVGQRGGQVGRGRGQRVEGRAAVGEIHCDPIRLEGELELHRRTSAMLDGVGEQLFQYQIEVELHVVREVLPAAEACNLRSDARQFPDVAVEYQCSGWHRRREAGKGRASTG